MHALRFRHTEGDHFYRTLKARAEEHFRTHGLAKTANAHLWWKVAFFAGLSWSCYGLALAPFTFDSLRIPLAVAFALFSLLLAINIGHDASHDALPFRPRINRLIHWLSFVPLGVSAYLWKLRHVNSHHIVPNVNGSDVDIDDNPFVRLSPNVPLKPWQRFQHLYAPFLYMLVTLNVVWREDYKYLRMKQLANLRNIRHDPRDVFGFYLQKLLYAGLWFGVPIFACGFDWRWVFAAYILGSMISSLAFVFLLIGTHFTDRAEFPKPDEFGNLPYTWAEHNLATACDWSPDSAFWSFVAGGVNSHAAHHLFPRIAHTHYPALVPMIREVAAEYGVPYHETSAWGMVAGHFRLLYALGKVPELQESPSCP
jgi:linoleoyl-CoA desaturase